MENVVTLLYTSIDRDDLFAWQHSIFESGNFIHCLRVDTWQIQDHPTPSGETFTLYACTMVFEARKDD